MTGETEGPGDSLPSEDDKKTVEVCQNCGKQFDGFMDAVLNAPSSCGPFEQRTIDTETEQ